MEISALLNWNKIDPKFAMPSNRRDQRDTNIILALGNWIKKRSPNLAHPERWSSSLIARIIVACTLFLWFVIFILGFILPYEKQVPQLAFLPLFAFFPGEILSGQPNSNPAFLQAWGVGAGIVFLALASAATYLGKRFIAIGFAGLFFISTLIVYARVVVQVRNMYMHQ